MRQRNMKKLALAILLSPVVVAVAISSLFLIAVEWLREELELEP